MTAANTTNRLPLLKRLWGNKVQQPFHKASKFFSLMQKDTNFGGEGRYVIVDVAPTAGGSSLFAEALANQDAPQTVRFFVTHRKEYQIFSIQGDLIARTKGDKNAMVEAVKDSADKARYSFARILARRAWGNGGGSLGRLDAGVTLASTTLTLRSRVDVLGFEPGMYIQFASDDGSAASPAGLRDGGAKLRVTAVNRKTGVLTVSANLSTIAGITVNDYVFRAGDYANASTGMRGWAPPVDPSASESFMGVDRTLIDIQRTSGIRIEGGGGSKEETLNDACAELQLAGAMTADLFANPLDVSALIKELSSKKSYNETIELKSSAGVGFEAIKVHSPLGTIRVFSETDVPQGYAWLQDTSEVYCRSAGDVPTMLNDDGVGKLLRSATDDAYQGRLGAYFNFFNENPGHTGIITW